MARTFEFPIPADTDIARRLADARERAREAGVSLEGDDAGGRFRGTAEGVYRVEGSTLVVEVTKKPSFAPWSMIESGLRKVFA